VRRGPQALVLFFACFLAVSLACQGFLGAAFLARFQVKGVTLDLLDDVFLLYLAFEPTKRVFQGFALLDPYLCQPDTPPNCTNLDP